MNRTLPLVVLAALVAATAFAAPAPRAVSGDVARGASLFRLHCASCHGLDARGDGPLAPQLGAPAPTNLRDVAFLMQRGDDDLEKAIAQGGKAKGSFTMPAFAGQLGILDIWDLVAFVRDGQPSVGEYFPAAARFTAKAYTFDADGTRRLEAALGKLAADEGQVVLVTAFGGDKVEGDEPAYVPHDPRLLDALKPKQKLGYLAFATVALPGAGTVPLTIALEKSGAIARLKAKLDGVPEKERAALEKALSGLVGQGGKASPYQELKTPAAAAAEKAKKPAPKKDDPKAVELAKAVSRAYLRAVEAAVQFDKEERERHWAD